MTAIAAPAREGLFSRGLRAIPLRPIEGWLSLLTTIVMVVFVAFSLQDAGWTPNANGDTGFLPWLAFVGLAFGVGGAKIGWGRWRTHIVGALFAGLILPLVVGGVAHTYGWDPHGLAERLNAAFIVMRNVWTDLVVFARPYTTEYSYYYLVFGAVVWGAGMLAGFTVFGHRRPLDAVVVLGLVMLANMALSSRGDGQLWMLIVFSAAALLLLIRTHVFEEEVTWARRKIGDPSSVGQLYLVAGAQFVIVAVLGSVLLTATASSAPLQGVFRDLPEHLQSVSQWLERFAPPGGGLRGIGAVAFGGKDAVTNGHWEPSDRVAFRVQLPRTEDERFKWRAGTFSEYTIFGWDWGDYRREPTGAGLQLLGGDVNGDKPDPTQRRTVTVHVIPDAFSGKTILSPNTITTVNRPADALVVGASGWFTTVEGGQSGTSYDVTALVPVFDNSNDEITEPQLRAAGTDYPADLKAIYTALPDGSMGEASTALLETIRRAVVAPSYADPANPYDLARTIQGYLQSGDNFKYQEDVRTERNAQCPGGMSTVECFARMRVGYCDYYASTMAVLLRASGVPARVAYGFLPGDRGTDGMEVVGSWLAHYWVEVYFPGIGWIEFDPTGGGVGEPVAIASGSVGPSTPRPSRPSATPGDITPLPSIPGFGPGGGVNPTTGVGPFIAIGIILLVVVAALVLASLRRTPNKPMHPDKAWGSVARLASRVGLGPRPSQTVYEYAGVLGDAVPAARLELTTIARAKVEVAYGRQDLENDRLRRIAVAYQRLRFALLGIILRRGWRRRLPRRRR